MPVSQVTHQGTACGPPQRLGHAALFDQGRGKGQMTCARRPSPRISAGELPGRTDRPWLSPSNTAEHRREDARRPSLGGSRWPSEDVSRQLDLPKKDGTVHNTVLSHWTNSKKLFLINGLGAAFCFHRPLQDLFPILRLFRFFVLCTQENAETCRCVDAAFLGENILGANGPGRAVS